MKPINIILEEIKNFLSSDIPGRFSSAGLDDIQRFTDYPPVNIDERVLAVYLGTGDHSEDFSISSFILQAQLPGILDPKEYVTEISRSLLSFNPASVFADSLSFSYGAWYPGEIKDGGAGSFVVFEVNLSGNLDDCRNENNF